MNDQPNGDGTRKLGRKSKPVTQERLRKAALAHIDRYATSSDNLRDVLMRRIHRSVRLHGTDPDRASGWADEIVADLVARNLVNDRQYAENRALSLYRRGTSRRKIEMYLRTKGVGPADITEALVALEETDPDSEFTAACRHAQRRRLGPWRRENRLARRDNDLAAMARAGFSYGIASQVINADDIEALEEESEQRAAERRS
ncbi:MAG: regulator [Alphaproteobacteria bacterium]|nr:regulator [Alphaproteobacteria bacterium]